jgi:hypothetical protein
MCFESGAQDVTKRRPVTVSPTNGLAFITARGSMDTTLLASTPRKEIPTSSARLPFDRPIWVQIVEWCIELCLSGIGNI